MANDDGAKQIMEKDPSGLEGSDFDSVRSFNIARNENFLRNIGLNGPRTRTHIAKVTKKTKKVIVANKPQRVSARVASMSVHQVENYNRYHPYVYLIH